ncbi:MAG TPA: RagB/SusD family nutrient uptake outer membrane protein [Balneolaceae bacterium]|nr:RagB/SusD family nutrient uptake outer membrane protein [Balneolaceae bacterium]
MFNKKNRIVAVALLVVVAALITSCVESLNTEPLDKDIITSVSVYETPEDFRQVLAKLYAGFAATGQRGPAGDADIKGIDEGFSSYIRQYFTAQVIPTDEAVIAWSDPGLPAFNFQEWGASNDFVMGMYSRIFYEIAMTNEFIRAAEGKDNPVIQEYAAEARFLRALSYWHALDLYGGGVPFVTEEDGVGAYLPKPVGSDSLFAYIESELKAIAPLLPAPQQNEYGRADRAAAWTLLTKLYLNADVYLEGNNPHYTEAITYAKKVIDQGGYTLENNYQDLFLADNHTANGVIFAINFDGTHTKTYGGTNFIIHAAIGGSMDANNFGVDGGWAGLRVTPEFVAKFDLANDSRALFYTNGQTLEIADVHEFTNGYAVTKWKNITSTGQLGSVPAFADTDFPMFRLADVYLMYAEAILRDGQGGSKAEALQLVNEIRERAYGNTSGNITMSELTLDFILDERARELYWEGHRRTDLIRYGLFTSGDYPWAWKGGTQEGTGTASYYRLYPIPASDINANPNLTQNEGY